MVIISRAFVYIDALYITIIAIIWVEWGMGLSSPIASASKS